MILRTIVLALGLCGALVAAQFPAYSQQYLQRLGGAVAALDKVVADFDHSAAAQGMTRSAALAQMRGTAFVDARRLDMQRTFARHTRLRADLALLEGHGPFMRAYFAARLTDREIATGAFAAFRPALPLSFAGALFAFFGFLVTVAAVNMCVALCGAWGRKPQQAA
ncbi:MAG: DUF2937 family protein [Roseobacter sp.]